MKSKPDDCHGRSKHGMQQNRVEYGFLDDSHVEELKTFCQDWTGRVELSKIQVFNLKKKKREEEEIAMW
jgi:hypothetical protein